MNEQKPEVNIGFGFLSFFIPLAGIILFFVWKEEKTKAMTRCLVPALVAIGLEIVFVIIWSVFIVGMIAASAPSYY